MVGVFLFSEVTWAARSDYRYTVPSVPYQGNNPLPIAPKSGLKETIWQMFQKISNALIPQAYAFDFGSSSSPTSLSSSTGSSGYSSSSGSFSSGSGLNFSSVSSKGTVSLNSSSLLKSLSAAASNGLSNIKFNTPSTTSALINSSLTFNKPSVTPSSTPSLNNNYSNSFSPGTVAATGAQQAPGLNFSNNNTNPQPVVAAPQATVFPLIQSPASPANNVQSVERGQAAASVTNASVVTGTQATNQYALAVKTPEGVTAAAQAAADTVAPKQAAVAQIVGAAAAAMNNVKQMVTEAKETAQVSLNQIYQDAQAAKKAAFEKLNAQSEAFEQSLIQIKQDSRETTQTAKEIGSQLIAQSNMKVQETQNLVAQVKKSLEQTYSVMYQAISTAIEAFNNKMKMPPLNQAITPIADRQAAVNEDGQAQLDKNNLVSTVYDTLAKFAQDNLNATKSEYMDFSNKLIETVSKQYQPTGPPAANTTSSASKTFVDNYITGTAGLTAKTTQLLNALQEASSYVKEYLSTYKLTDSTTLHANDPPCGAVALAPILGVDASTLSAELSPSNNNQNSMYELQTVAANHGTTLNGRNISYTDLTQISGESTIAYLDMGNNQGHYVTVTGSTADTVTYCDATGCNTVSSAQFQSQWTGSVLTTNSTIGQPIPEATLRQTYGGLDVIGGLTSFRAVTTPVTAWAARRFRVAQARFLPEPARC